MEPVNCLIEGPIPEDLLPSLGMGEPGLHAHGALACFLGIVRADKVGDKEVEAIEYSAYPEMVGSVIEQIREELFSRFPDLHGVGIWHGTGLIRCGEISLVVKVATGHRQQCFAALELCVERVKEKLPVWKKEIFSDGTSRWIE